MKRIIILFAVIFFIGFANSDVPEGNVIAVKDLVVEPPVRGEDSDLSATAFIRNFDDSERDVDLIFYITDTKGIRVGVDGFEASLNKQPVGALETKGFSHSFDKTKLTFELEGIETYFVVVEAYLDESEPITETHLYDNSRKRVWTNAVKRTPGFPEANHLSVLIVLLTVSLIIFYRKKNS